MDCDLASLVDILAEVIEAEEDVGERVDGAAPALTVLKGRAWEAEWGSGEGDLQPQSSSMVKIGDGILL